MVPDKFERYAVSNGPEGLHIRMRQVVESAGCGALALGVLTILLVRSWKSGSDWALAGFFVLPVAIVAMGAAWMEDWVISHGEIRFKNSFRLKGRCVRRTLGEPVALRVEIRPRDSDGDLPMFAHVVHLIGPDGKEVGYGFAFQKESNLDRFLETLRRVLPLDVDDDRWRKKVVDKPRKSPPDMSDRWLD